jgi:hypothetical protein
VEDITLQGRKVLVALAVAEMAAHLLLGLAQALLEHQILVAVAVVHIVMPVAQTKITAAQAAPAS